MKLNWGQVALVGIYSFCAGYLLRQLMLDRAERESWRQKSLQRQLSYLASEVYKLNHPSEAKA